MRWMPIAFLLVASLITGCGTEPPAAPEATGPAAAPSGAPAYDVPKAPPKTPSLDEARRELAQAPDSARAHYNLGLAYYQAGRYWEAIPAFQEAIRLNPKVPASYFWQAYSYMALDDLEKSADVFRRITSLPDIRPAFASEAYLEIGNIHWEFKQYEEAVRAFQESLRLNPKQGVAALGLGMLYLQDRRHEEARRYLRQATDTIYDKTKIATAHAALGQIAERENDRQEALREYRKALEADSANPVARDGLRRLAAVET